LKWCSRWGCGRSRSTCLSLNELKAYLSGPLFRQQVEQVVSLAAELEKGLSRERTQHERARKEAHASFERILSAAIGI